MEQLAQQRARGRNHWKIDFSWRRQSCDAQGSALADSMYGRIPVLENLLCGHDYCSMSSVRLRIHQRTEIVRTVFSAADFIKAYAFWQDSTVVNDDFVLYINILVWVDVLIFYHPAVTDINQLAESRSRISC